MLDEVLAHARVRRPVRIGVRTTPGQSTDARTQVDAPVPVAHVARERLERREVADIERRRLGPPRHGP
jgi:hypothetical protein